MHVLLWTAAGQLYAVPTAHLREVTPVVKVRAIPHAVHWLLGRMDYRGSFLAVIDFPRFLGHSTWTPRMTSRILIVQRDQQQNGDLVGLLVESVIGSEQIEFPTRPTTTSSTNLPSLLDSLVATPYGTVQLIDLAQLPRGEQHVRAGDVEHDS